MIEVYTDGSYSIHRGIGKWAVVVVEDKKVIKTMSDTITHSTSNRAELTAVIKALEYLKDVASAIIYSDSTYVVQGYNTWMYSWKKSDWGVKRNKPIKNDDLWSQIYSLRSKNIKIKWIKRNTKEYNILADGLAGNY